MNVGGGLSEIHRSVAAHYGASLARFGATPAGVDWSSGPAQQMRFVQLLKLCDLRSPFSLNDLGCGYGALASFARRRHRHCPIDYLGTDLCEDMVAAGRRRFVRSSQPTRFEAGSACSRLADYTVASGIFNVRLGHGLMAWENMMRTTLAGMRASGRRGFAFNVMAALDVPAREGIYRGDPVAWQRFCERELGARTEVIGDYGLREVTLLARY